MQEKQTGIFQFSREGFEATLSTGKRHVKWDEIEQLLAYKRDLLTTDQICIDIILSKTIITFSEDTEGWETFIKKIKQQFTIVPVNWESEIIKPAFATNFIVLYRKE